MMHGPINISFTSVSSEMFIDYKVETICFGTFGYNLVSSKITWDHSIYDARARCFDGEMSASRLCFVIRK